MIRLARSKCLAADARPLMEQHCSSYGDENIYSDIDTLADVNV